MPGCRTGGSSNRAWVSANKTYYMQGFNLSDEFSSRDGRISSRPSGTNRFGTTCRIGSNRRRGACSSSAGAGNDVAAAVRNAREGRRCRRDRSGDPLGRRENYHPESPYQLPGVRKITNDARAFMKRSHAGVYDLVVFDFSIRTRSCRACLQLV